MTREEIKNKVAAIVADKMGFPVNKINENTSFKYDLGTDSLDDIEIVMEFDRKFGITIKDEEIVSVSTVGEAIDVICKNLDVPICKQQSEVDLEKEIERWFDKGDITDTRFDNYNNTDIERTARHFYKLGLNARK